MKYKVTRIVGSDIDVNQNLEAKNSLEIRKSVEELAARNTCTQPYKWLDMKTMETNCPMKCKWHIKHVLQ